MIPLMKMILLLALGFSVKAVTIHDFSGPKLFGQIAHNQMQKDGYFIISDNRLKIPEVLAETLIETAKHYPTLVDFSYALGNVQGRTSIAGNIHKIGGAPAHIYVTGHSEASYLENSPRFLLFTCLEPVDDGGQTPIFNIKKLVEVIARNNVGRQLLSDVKKDNVTYIRNDVSQESPLAEAKAVNYPTWQNRFKNMTKAEIIEKMQNNNIHAYFDENDTLHSEWTFSGFRPHPDTGEDIWFNQLYAMNGYYWKQHGVQEILDLPLDKRPLHTKVGTDEHARDLTEEEYLIINSAHLEVEEKFAWKKGRVLFVDNFAYQHGRLPYKGHRKCAVGWGPTVGSEGLHEGKYAVQETTEPSLDHNCYFNPSTA